MTTNQTRNHLLIGADVQRRYVVAATTHGAMFTLKSRQSGRHITFSVEATPDLRHWLVYHLVDGGVRRPVFIGWIRRRDLHFRRKRHESLRTEGHMRAQAAMVMWWGYTRRDVTVPQIEAWGSGVCARCGRELTDPLSSQRGIGPVCWEHTKTILDLRPRLDALAVALEEDGFSSPLWTHAPAELLRVDEGHLAAALRWMASGDVAAVGQVLELLRSVEVDAEAVQTLAGVAGALAVHAEGVPADRKALRDALAEMAPPVRKLGGWWLPDEAELEAAAK
jgi:hypothetical protein